MKTKNHDELDASQRLFVLASCRRHHPFSKTNPFADISITLANFTHSIQGTLDRRYDYILPCGLLFANLQSSQIFRTDLLSPVPLNLNSNDDLVASDHLPVLMVFHNPYTQPFALTTLVRTQRQTLVTWQTVPGQSYRLETSADLTNWETLADNLLATNGSFTFSTNLPMPAEFFRVQRLP